MPYVPTGNPPGRPKGDGTLLRPKGGRPLIWTPELLQALEDCARRDMCVQAIERRLGVHDRTLVRGALICLQQRLRERAP